MSNIELNKKRSKFIKVNARDGVDFFPEKLRRTINYSDGSMIKTGKKVLYYTPKQKKKRNVKIGVITGVLATLGTLGGVFHPVITQSIQRLKTETELHFSPERKEITDDLIPEFPNDSEFISDTRNDEYLNLSENALIAMIGLRTKINDVFQKYSDLEGTLTPAFVLVNFENQVPTSFKLICDLDQNRFISFEYEITDTASFEKILEFRDVEVTDIINGFNNSLINRNLVDAPSVGRKVSIDNRTYYLDDITKEVEATEYNYETKTYDFEDFYMFNKYYNEGTKLSQEIIRIKKSDVEIMEGFDANNIASVYDIYLNDSGAFEKLASLDLGKDKISMILISAKQMSQNQENNFEQ